MVLGWLNERLAGRWQIFRALIRIYIHGLSRPKIKKCQDLSNCVRSQAALNQAAKFKTARVE
jgi:hypothetical protein